MALKWGIAGAGKISTQFAKSLSVLPQSEHVVLAVGAQNQDRAQTFASDLNIPKAYGSYKALAEDSDIDVVYVGNLNTQHLEVSKLMLDHGKHVLCEKPLTINEKETRELIEYANTKNLFLMEAIWSRFFPSYDKLKELIDSQTVGEILYVSANFGRAFDYVKRLASKELGGGTILDLGVYGLQFIQFVYGIEQPTAIVSVGHLNADGVDESASAFLAYKGGRTGAIVTHSKANLSNEACVIGTKGTITVPRFWSPTSLVTPTGTLEFDLPNTYDVQFRHPYSVGMSYEAQEVRRCIQKGLTESPKMTHQESIQLAQFMDKIRRDVGVEFTQDN